MVWCHQATSQYLKQCWLKIHDAIWWLDESTARRQLKSPQSLSGRSLHLALVTKWSRSHMTLKIQISRSWPRSNPLSNLRPRVQIDMFAFSLVAIGPLLVEIQQISYLTLKIQGQGQAKVKSDSYIWALEFNRCVHFSFRGNQTIFGRDIANAIFDLENSRSRSWPRSNLMVTFEVLRSIDMFAFHFVAIAPFFADIFNLIFDLEN